MRPKRLMSLASSIGASPKRCLSNWRPFSHRSFASNLPSYLLALSSRRIAKYILQHSALNRHNQCRGCFLSNHRKMLISRSAFWSRSEVKGCISGWHTTNGGFRPVSRTQKKVTSIAKTKEVSNEIRRWILSQSRMSRRTD